MQLEDIKILRKNLGLTQAQLARQSGVSQSLIAKVEATRLDPTYTKAMQIFETLERLQKQEGASIAEVMTTEVVFLKPGSKVKDAIRKMKEHGISQIPIIDAVPVGLVTESSILDKMIDDPTSLAHAEVAEIMGDAPPTITKNTSLKAAQELLKHFPLLLVVDKGVVAGLVTRADLVQKALRR